MSVRANLIDLAKLKQHGYTVERFTGTIGGWMLLDPEGDQLTIGDHGGIAPTQWEAVAEGLGRIERDERIERELAQERANTLSPYEQWMVRSNLETIRSAAAQQVAVLRAGGYHRVAEAVERELGRGAG